MENYVEFKNISKAFVGVQALDNISFRADGGEVCALLGENGAGKSTLLKILTGAREASSGEYFINGEKVRFTSPIEALRYGVSVIYQERQLVGDLSVTENVFMEDLYRNKLGVVNFRKSHGEMKKLINLFQMPFSPHDKVNSLSVAHQQMVEIMKAYRRNSMIIAFDEPTASLSDPEIEVLFSLIEKLKQKGKVIFYVSHRMKEIFKIADKIIILKDGCFIEEVKTSDATEDELVLKMVGRNIGDVFNNLSRNDKIGEVVLEAKGLENDYIKDVNFTLRKGEVLGFAGLVGAGRSETIRAIFGADKLNAGEIYVNGKIQKIRSPRNAILAGIGVCPEDRKEQGLVLDRSIRENLTIPILHNLAKLGVISRRNERQIARQAVEKQRIKTPSIDKVAVELSGGNQQKVILGRWLLANLRVLILDEPTKGIDVGTKAEIYQMICDLAKSGLGVIFISSELPEVVNVSDRVIVMREGRITGELKRKELSEENVLKLAMRER
ncbi:sugar ABC transporter ATP-binding protein [Sediminispirochaeta smaragdinae]|uniref:ABC transporter related protein n=1 Tax=Sediminispirochaeta smaragdinae (strain DSM 11293 / JCM 15392 / SEBR 4228) TaxID=573413 RepID=E1R4U5_SEDSS|nr:sugar ABC transporter ATP-binding protein [Sediminispirochaeta smaragdinae]ADK82183.1 ABC transporter related protein [Sediminispirochaeta smaragdinae DSM 11293]